MVTPLDILNEYRELKQIQKRAEDSEGLGDFFRYLLNGLQTKSAQHEAQFLKVRYLARANQGAQRELLFSGLVTDPDELIEILLLGEGIGYEAKDNKHMIHYIELVYQKRMHLPEKVKERVCQLREDWVLTRP